MIFLKLMLILSLLSFAPGHVLGGNVAAVKPMMAFVGVDLGPPRLPMRPMTVDELLEFKKDMQEIGFQSWDPAVIPT